MSEPTRARPVVVTGGASGMGRATAAALAAAGHPVGLLDRDADGLARVAQDLRATGASVATAIADVTDDERVGEAFDELSASHGPCWGLAAAAGVLPAARPMLETTSEQLRQMLEVNVLGVHHAARHALRQMRSSGDGGRIVAWGSDAAVGGVPGFGPYALAKAAVVSLCATLAVEYGGEGIAVNAILPGPVRTPMAAYLTDAEVAASEATIPLGRWVRAEEIAATVAHLMSEAGGAITGVALPVDGGRLASYGRLTAA